MATPTNEQIAHLLNNLNMGTNKAKLGDIIVELLQRVAALEAAVEALQTP